MQISKTALASLILAALARAEAPVAPTVGTPQTVTGALGDAQPQLNNPTGKDYVADFSNTKLGGSIKFKTTMEQNKPVQVSVQLFNFPAIGGPFTYHIHVDPVPADGNCTKTLAHLDPWVRGQAIPCDPTRPESCEVGDLAGKHGAINATIGNTTYTTSYTDQYITLEQGKGAYIGNRSVVVHLADRTRYACANITEIFKVAQGPKNTPTIHEGAGFKSGASSWGLGLVAAGLGFLLI